MIHIVVEVSTMVTSSREGRDTGKRLVNGQTTILLGGVKVLMFHCTVTVL